MSIDSICLNEECIKNKLAFFQFDQECVHLVQNHHVKSIHPITFASFFPRQQISSTINPKATLQTIQSDLLKMRDQAFQSIVDAVRTLFYDPELMKPFEESLSIIDNLDIKGLIAKLRECSYSILQHISDFEAQKNQKNFKSFLTNLAKHSQQQLKKHFESLKGQFLNVCNNFGASKKIVHQIQQKKPVELTEMRPQIVQNVIQQKKPQTFEASKIHVKEQYIPKPYQQASSFERQEKMDEQLDQQDDNSEQNQQRSENPNKSKPIEKPLKRPRKKRRSNFILAEGIEIVSQQEAIVKESRYPLKTFSFLQQQVPLLTTLHIFQQNFASKQIMINLLEKFPKLSKITLNCHNELQLVDLSQAPSQMLKNLKIELKWDFHKFFTDYFAYCSFPAKTIKRRERKKPVYVQEIIKILPANHSLWFCHYLQIERLETIPINFNNITELHFQRFQPYVVFNFSHKSFSNFHNIQTLTLKNLNLYSSDVRHLIQTNRLLSTIAIINCDFSTTSLKQILSSIASLDYLSKFFIHTQSCDQIDINIIFSMKSLTHLAIHHYGFRNEEQPKSSIDLKDIGKLNNLSFLSFFDCNIFSDFLSYLSQSTVSSLTYLNLGKTRIDNEACRYIKRMQKLQYLNLDDTNIDGDSLADMFTSMSRVSFIDNPLKFLSIQKKVGFPEKFKVQNMKEIAKNLPRLTYLNIAYNQNLVGYSYFDFKRLKTLAVDRQQFQKLQDIIWHEIVRYKVQYKS